MLLHVSSNIMMLELGLYVYISQVVTTLSLATRPLQRSLRRFSATDVSPSASPLASEAVQKDDLQAHVVGTHPRHGDTSVELTASILVHFDRDVRSVDTDKLFEVEYTCTVTPCKLTAL